MDLAIRQKGGASAPQEGKKPRAKRKFKVRYLILLLALLAVAAVVECFVTPALMGWAGLGPA